MSAFCWCGEPHGHLGKPHPIDAPRRSADLALDLGDFIIPEHEPEATIQQRFEAFHYSNPWIFTALESLTAGWLAKGHTRVGVKQMVEVVRWQYGLATSGDRGFRVNNDFTSRYARLLVEKHPEWAGAIETRTLRAA